MLRIVMSDYDPAASVGCPESEDDIIDMISVDSHYEEEKKRF